MKKLWLVMVAAVLVIALAACGGNSAPPADGGPESAAPVSAPSAGPPQL